MDGEGFEVFGLREIAGWAVGDYRQAGDKGYVALPAIQRGFVWRPEQVERLWDSIACGFPIGSFLLEKYDSKAVWHGYNGGSKRDDVPSPGWLLLDGQQRVTSIIKGFQDVWSRADGKDGQNRPVSALWVDISPKAMARTDRRFLFRLVTQSHPWGYQRSDPGRRLSAQATYDALSVFRVLSGESGRRAHEFGLHEVFPWDSRAPVPVALLIQAIRETGGRPDEVARELLRRLEDMTLWQSWKRRGGGVEGFDHFGNVEKVLTEGPRKDFAVLVMGLYDAINGAHIPAPVLSLNKDRHGAVGTRPEDAGDEAHPVFNLFKRINSGGTTLSREEIHYSLLKSVWPEAREVIEDDILGERRFCQPARMVSLMSRLFLMVEGKTADGKPRQKEGLQDVLSIAQFQNLLGSGEQQQSFEFFCQERGKRVVDELWALLTDGDHGLPKVLAADLFRGHPDLILTVMYWLSQVEDIDKLSEDERQRTLGFITAVAWFAEDAGLCVKQLASRLMAATDGDPTGFFSAGQFVHLSEADDRGRIGMIMPPTPEKVEDLLRRPWKEGEVSPFSEKDDTWSHRDFWSLYPREYFDDVEHSDALRSFLHAVLDDPKWRKLLYAQRGLLDEWFDWFDPTHPETITDRNRPWDYDHILPRSWTHDGRGIFSHLPGLLKVWADGSIGNFRVWPMESNRSKGNDEIFEDGLPAYGIKGIEGVMKWSFVRRRSMDAWLDLHTECADGGRQFWGHGEGCDEHCVHRDLWRRFVEAALLRTVDIYREWYERLRIADLTVS